jgi:1-aminocyclopropane-1-carboxylate deaminase
MISAHMSSGFFCWERVVHSTTNSGLGILNTIDAIGMRRWMQLLSWASSLSVIMLHLTSGFMLRAGRTTTRPIATFLTSEMDDLFDEVLNNQNFTMAVNPTTLKSGFPENPSIPWRIIDWKKEEANIIPTPPSPVDIVMVRDRLVYLKRDDQLRLPGSQISGNKARKMLTLNAMVDFPACIVSYGGPQSNAMLALAAVVHFHNVRAGSTSKGDPKRKRFVYYTKKLPRFLKNQPSGNLFRALSLGMELQQLSPLHYSDMFGGDFGGNAEPPVGLAPPVVGDSVWVPQGGASGIAQAGSRLLANEIVSYWAEHGAKRPLSVFLPGGTCTTALFLHQAIHMLQQEQSLQERLDIAIIVIPCVGDEGYARRQMLALNTQFKGEMIDIPTILPATPDDSYFGQTSGKENKSYFQFGEPMSSILDVYSEMRDDCKVILDLLYGAPAWAILLRHWRAKIAGSSPLAGREIMYVHSGGIEGINSQLLRYQYKGLASIDEIQQPGRR